MPFCPLVTKVTLVTALTEGQRADLAVDPHNSRNCRNQLQRFPRKRSICASQFGYGESYACAARGVEQ
jgi:hypothetical protein